MVDTSAAEKFMRMALAQARKGLGLTSPNPAVGALLVANGKIIARGYHEQAGCDHAEIKCLKQVRGVVPKDTALYVTLEPCSTTGRTPPCADAIIEAGIRNVVIGTIDPNPRHSGRAIEQLRRANVQVQAGVLADECAQLNEAFNKWIQTGTPFVIAKCGMSLDGRLTRPPNESQWLTTPESRRHAHRLRAHVDAILIGAETLRRDNPRLTARNGKNVKQPWRVVLSRSGKLPKDARVFTDRNAKRTMVYSGRPLGKILKDLGRREMTSVLIEGGGEVLGQALEAKLIDKVQIYLAPMICGGPVFAFPDKGVATTAEALRLTKMNYEKIGGDVCVTGYPAERRNDSE
jgi:diaminohydroxyphosphoribosylaminopyrimidine deaminase/5-amino-6-(5-phosphoribosylamino)uracil reductase